MNSMTARIRILISFIFLPVFALCQQKQIDSLEGLLKNPTVDTLQIDRLLMSSKLLWNSDPSLSLRRGKEALVLSQRLADSHRIGLSYISIGNAYLIPFQNPDSAIVVYKKAISLTELSNDKYVRAMALNNIGNCLKVKGKVGESQRFYEEALVIRKEIHDSSGIAATTSNLGTVYYQKGDLKRALDLYYEALPFKERDGNKAALASTYQNIGLVHLDRSEPDKAIEMIGKAKDLYILIGDV